MKSCRDRVTTHATRDRLFFYKQIGTDLWETDQWRRRWLRTFSLHFYFCRQMCGRQTSLVSAVLSPNGEHIHTFCTLHSDKYSPGRTQSLFIIIIIIGRIKVINVYNQNTTKRFQRYEKTQTQRRRSLRLRALGYFTVILNLMQVV